MEQDLQNEELKKERDSYVTRIFWLGFQIAFIFGVPAALAAFLGLKLDAHYDSGRKITLILLLLAFISSWSMVIVGYRRITKKLREIDSKIDNNR